MLLSVGTKVRLKRTGDSGVVSELLGDGWIRVKWQDGVEFPVEEDNIERLDNDRIPGAKVINTSTPKPNRVEKKEPALEYSFLKDKGISLALDPILKEDASASAYDVYLINASKYPIIYTLEFYLVGHKEESFNGKIDAFSQRMCGQFYFDELNDSPEYHIECRRLTTAGTGKALTKKLKIKAATFFKKLATAPILNKRVHLYQIFEDVSASEDLLKIKKKESLKDYTQKHLDVHDDFVYDSKTKKVNIHEVKSKAEFKHEIDLHIEKLTANSKDLDRSAIVQLQLKVFENYLEQAVRLGVDRVFIIHGIGEGKLKNAVNQRLRMNPYVKKYKNEYHAKYGYGATEVEF